MMQRLSEETYEVADVGTLPEAARREYLKDRSGLPLRDPGVEQAIDCGIKWLCLAQDKSISHDGGVAELYSLIDGWGPSYPETTGYIVPTMIDYARLRSDNDARVRAKNMLDWLVSIQFSDGSFQGGNIFAKPRVSTVFNTGQILLGLAAGVREFGDEYLEPMRRAGDWLVAVQDSDGCWRKFESPFVEPGEKTYSSHVAWGLLEAARIEPNRKYAEAALANVRWVLSQQTANGWFQKCCLDDPDNPLTHTLAYAWRGVLEAYLFARDAEFLKAAQKTANGVLKTLRRDGFIPGRIDEEWQGAVEWACLTGSVQIAHCWLLLYRLTDEERYRDAAYVVNRYVRQRMQVSGPPEIVGGIKGAFPVDGAYCDYNYINWACKFFVDSNILEREIRNQETGFC
jgi:hypothetical protein